jgi:hypothetical protein
MGLRDTLGLQPKLPPPAAPTGVRGAIGLPPRQMGPAEDAAWSVLSQGSNALADLAGGLGDTNNRINSGAQWVMKKFGASDETAQSWGPTVANAAMPLTMIMPDSETTRSFIPEAIQHEPQTATGDVAGRIAYNIPGAFAGPGSWMNKLLSAAGAGAAGFAGKEGSGYVMDKLGEYAPSYKDSIEGWRPYVEGGADILGNVVGSFAPNAARHAITPNPMTDERVANAALLDRRGVEMTAGQRTGNAALHAKEAQTGGTGYWNIRERQNRQYTAGALQDAGIPPRQPGGPRPDVASPEVLNQQHAALGAEFDRLQAIGMQPDSQFFSDLVQLRDDYRATMPQHNRAPIVETTVRQLADRAQRGIPVDGELLRNIGTQLRRTRQQFRASGRADDAEAIDSLIETIDSGLERSLAQTNPAEVGRFRQVREQYRNLITVEEAASNAPNGQLSPADLTRATKKMETRRGYSRGFGPFNEYSRAGYEILTDPPNSGTASRLTAALGGRGANTGAALIGGGLGYAVGGPVGAGVGAAIGSGADATWRAARNFVRMDPRMQGYLGNQVAREWTPEIGAWGRAGTIGATNATSIADQFGGPR